MREHGAGSGCWLTAAIWILAGLAMLGPIMGDCFPEMGHTCPTDHERNMSLLKIALGALAANVGVIWLLAYFRQRHEP